MTMKLLAFYALMALERVHPLEGGVLRRKYRRDRRSGLPIESRLQLDPAPGRPRPRLLATARCGGSTRASGGAWTGTLSYTDLAMTPVHDGELDELEMFSAPQGAKVVVEKLRRRTALRAADAAH